MYICNCQGVTEDDIRRAAASGVRTLRQLRAATGCATGCGGCVCQARELLHQNRPEPQVEPCFPMMFSAA